MNVHLENVNLSSNSGPNSFAQKLIKYASRGSWTFDGTRDTDAYLCFIESHRSHFDAPMFQRLDGIYFNNRFDYNAQNSNIKRIYDLADGVVYQSEFNRQLTVKYFGEHKNHTIIHNGTDLDKISQTPELKGGLADRYENVWSCASHWRPHKRLPENIRYFLEHSGKDDCLVVAGQVSEGPRHDRVFYVGNLPHDKLISLYKRSKYFLHLAWLDHCPNVVVDARASGCRVVCSSAGGTKEIAGLDAIVIEEDKWNFEPISLYEPPPLNFEKKIDNIYDTGYDMSEVAKKYESFCRRS
jgi:glycosyltransferase involved in cell wall biosynthesis